MTRPTGITLTALVLMLLSIAGFGNSYASIAIAHYSQTLLFTLVTFLYGLTALLAGSGLMQMKSWGHLWFRLWIVSLIFLIPETFNVSGSIYGTLFVLVFIAFILYKLDDYIRRSIKSGQADA